MSDTSCELLHEAIREALHAGDFETVRGLSTVLGQAIIREAQAVAPAERKCVVQKELGRLGEHLSLARVLRAHVASQLQNNTAALYHEAAGRPHSWRFDA